MNSPDVRVEPFERFSREDQSLYGEMNAEIQRLDTGVFRLGGEEAPFDNPTLLENLKTGLKEEIPEGAAVRLPAEWIKAHFIHGLHLHFADEKPIKGKRQVEGENPYFTE